MAEETEDFKVSGEELLKKVKQLIKEGNIRRIIIKSKAGKTIIEIPLSIGIVGAVLAPMLAAVAAIAALVTECTITVVRQSQVKYSILMPGDQYLEQSKNERPQDLGVAINIFKRYTPHFTMCRSQSANTVLMVQPDSFGFDEQTARTNVFQHKPNAAQLDIKLKATNEFNSVVSLLQQHDITVIIAKNDDSKVSKPDAVFPNNWLSTWPSGEVFLYPMATASRRVERNSETVAQLEKTFQISKIIDISQTENEGKYLESTGVLIFDHSNKIAYGCMSNRCDESLFRSHTKELGYTAIVFRAYDESGTPIYHTNIMLGIQTTTAIICSSLIQDKDKRAVAISLLTKNGHDVVEITNDQMKSFCANVLELQNKHDEKFLIMSDTAHAAFTSEQLERLSIDKKILVTSIKTIESVGGGGIRCMLAEIFLPSKA